MNNETEKQLGGVHLLSMACRKDQYNGVLEHLACYLGAIIGT